MRDFHLPGRSPVYAGTGMCATSHPLASKIALDILRDGGNAMDAAIAGAFLLGFCEPQMTGIGGDCFVLFSPAGSDEVKALNGSGRAPAALRTAHIREKGHARIDPRSADAVTIPGAVDAYCRLAADWGSLGLDRILAPAIHYAKAGVPVAPRVRSDWASGAGNLSGSGRDYFLIGGEVPGVGQMFRAPGQAKVLEKIAKTGRAGFYEGEVARDMVATLRAAGGCHTEQDFAEAACDYTTPILGTYKSAEVVEHPPNGQGAIAILIANMLSHFDIASMEPYGAERAHIEAEITKLAYDARNRFVGDPDATGRLDHLLDPATASALAALVDPAKAMESATSITESVHKETIYITVVDKDRMAVSLIYSIFDDFGSGMASSDYGILLHNRGAGFCLEDGHPNEARGGKRPLHTIIPGIVRRNGRVDMPFGVMGGQYQATGHARLISNIEDFGMDPQEAIDGPRCFALNGELRVENGYSETVKADLAKLGHKVVLPPTAIGGAQAIAIDHDNGVLVGGSDPRKDGCALGY